MNVTLKAYLKDRNYIGLLKYKNVKYTDNYFITNEVGMDTEFFMNKKDNKFTLLDIYNNFLCGGYLSDKDVNGITFPASADRDMTYFNNEFEMEEDEEYFLLRQKNEHYHNDYYVSYKIQEYNFGKYDIMLCLSANQDKAVRFKRL